MLFNEVSKEVSIKGTDENVHTKYKATGFEQNNILKGIIIAHD